MLRYICLEAMRAFTLIFTAASASRKYWTQSNGQDLCEYQYFNSCTFLVCSLAIYFCDIIENVNIIVSDFVGADGLLVF